MPGENVDGENTRADLAHGQTCGSGVAVRAGLCVTQFADLPAEAILDARALGRCFSVSTRTLRRMVARGQLPRGIKLGRRRMWLAGKVLQYLTAEADRRAAEAKRIASRLRELRG